MPRKICFNEKKKDVIKLYESGMSIYDIAKHFKVGWKAVYNYFKRHKIERRTLKKAKEKSSKTMVGLNAWRKLNGSWNKGLDLTDDRIKKLVIKGKKTQIKNGKNAGKNNPMYGKKCPHTKNGFRKDLGHSVRSSWEANFARILNFLKIEYQYEKQVYELSNGKTYLPDFYIPSKNMFYEIKGRISTNEKCYLFSNEYLIKVTLIDEKFYNKLIKKFMNHVTFDDSKSFYNNQELIKKYKKYLIETPKRKSVTDFCRKNNFNTKMIKRMFGSLEKFKNYNAPLEPNSVGVS